MKVNSFVTGAAMMALAASVPAFAGDNYALDELQLDSGISTEYRVPAAAAGASADARMQPAAPQHSHPALEQLQSDSGVSTEYRPAPHQR